MSDDEELAPPPLSEIGKNESDSGKHPNDGFEARSEPMINPHALSFYW